MRATYHFRIRGLIEVLLVTGLSSPISAGDKHRTGDHSLIGTVASGRGGSVGLVYINIRGQLSQSHATCALIDELRPVINTAP